MIIRKYLRRLNTRNFKAPYKSPRSSYNVTEKTWIVPLTCTKQFQPDFSNTQPTMWLIDETQIVLNNEVRNDEWYICNLQQSGNWTSTNNNRSLNIFSDSSAENANWNAQALLLFRIINCSIICAIFCLYFNTRLKHSEKFLNWLAWNLNGPFMSLAELNMYSYYSSIPLDSRNRSMIFLLQISPKYTYQ